MTEMHITNKACVEVDNRTWHLFIADFDSPDGKFEFHFYALSFEHAAMLLEEIKQSARITGKFEGMVK